ncbi:MAG: AMP-binding protein, partial [Nitrococcus sp.]|nr:AMP-binding protein [Nitrococcus sp.]
PVAATNVPDRLDTRDWNVQIGCKPGTVGMPLPGTACRVVDPDSHTTLPVGTDGMILIGGVQVMTGYLDDPQRTAKAVIEIDSLRWYRSGDRGHLDEDGFLTIVDRYSRFAKIGGEMISLTRVEDAIREALDDKDSELLAVNVPDERKGERIVLLVEDGADADGMREAIGACGLHPLMMPAEVRVVAGIPKLGSGKLDIRAARALASKAASAPREETVA